jgi:hypothetical protein
MPGGCPSSAPGAIPTARAADRFGSDSTETKLLADCVMSVMSLTTTELFRRREMTLGAQIGLSRAELRKKAFKIGCQARN